MVDDSSLSLYLTASRPPLNQTVLFSNMQRTQSSDGWTHYQTQGIAQSSNSDLLAIKWIGETYSGEYVLIDHVFLAIVSIPLIRHEYKSY